MKRSKVTNRGFSFMELVISLAIGGIIIGGATLLLHQSLKAKAAALGKASVQHNLRVGLNHLVRDLAMAGTGTPRGGVQLPLGTELAPQFGCDEAACYVAQNTFPERRLFPVTPGNARGATLANEPTDVVTIVYRDFSTSLSQFVLSSLTSTSAQVSNQTSPDLTDEEHGVEVGDVVVLCNANGCAAVVITERSGFELSFEEEDPLNFNQPSAGPGSVAAIANPEGEEQEFPPTTAFLMRVITYYVDASSRRLMRQENAHSPIPLAEEVYSLQLTYDVFDDDASAASAGLPDAGGLPNQIRKINVLMAASDGLNSGTKHQESLSTSVSTRNLAFRDRYQ